VPTAIASIVDRAAEAGIHQKSYFAYTKDEIFVGAYSTGSLVA
jgi:hypothetical protein